MQKELLAYLQLITDEEQEILAGNQQVRKNRYTEKEQFVVDSQKMLEKGRLLALRSNTRFVHFPRHRHNYIEVMYMCAGECTHIIGDGERVVLKAGDLLFLGNHTEHEILPCMAEDIAVNFIILPQFFDKPFAMMEEQNVLRDFLIAAISGGGSEGDFLHFKAKDHLPVENLMETMIWSILHKTGDTATLLQTAMGLLLMHLSDLTECVTQGGTHRSEKKTVLEILKYIENNYRDGTLEHISAQVHQPMYTVSRLLKKHAGGNFKELLQRRKMQQAAFLLSQTTLSIERIMETVGYNNSSYFYRTFRASYGLSPKEYREKKQN